MKVVLVSGCYDLLHSGHVRFFQSAAEYGQLHVALGSDETICELKHRLPINSEQERLYMVQSCQYVHAAFVSKGSGMLDFAEDARALKPDVFVVNGDGHSASKEAFVRSQLGGCQYIVLDRTPAPLLEPRSTTSLRKLDVLPYRIDVAGGWLDQPWVSSLCPGPVITLGLNATHTFNERSGMATSTRNKWKLLSPVSRVLCTASYSSASPASFTDTDGAGTAAQTSLALARTAELLFAFDNPPGTEVISGAQDAIGLVFPGLAKSKFEGKFWPSHIDRIMDDRILTFVESSLRLLPLEPRAEQFDVFLGKSVNEENARNLSNAANDCWQSMQQCDIRKFGSSVRASFEAQIAMFPAMVNPSILQLIDKYRGHEKVYGWKISGAGGGGYLILICDPTLAPLEGELKISVRRK